MLGLGLHKGIGQGSGGDPNLLFSAKLDSLDQVGGAKTGWSIETPRGTNVPAGLTSALQLNGDHSGYAIGLVPNGEHIEEAYITIYWNPYSIVDPPLTFRSTYFEMGPFGGTDLWEINFNGAGWPTLDFEGPFDAGARSMATVNSGGLDRWYKVEIYHKMTATENILDCWVDGVDQNFTTNSPNEGPNLRTRSFVFASQTSSQFGLASQYAGLTIHRKKFVDIINP